MEQNIAEKGQNKLSSLFYGTTALLFGYIFVLVMVQNGAIFGSMMAAGSFALLLIIFGAVLFFRQQINRLPARKFWAAMAMGTFLFGIISFWLGREMYTALHSDLEAVFQAVTDLLQGGKLTTAHAGYFARWNNNLLFLLLLTAVYAVAGVFGIPADTSHLEPGVLLAAFCIALALWLLCRLVWQVTKQQTAAVLAFLLGVLHAPFYFWSSIFYTDVLAMPLALGVLYLYAKFVSQWKLRWLVGSGAVAGLLFLLKGSGAAAAVAVPLAHFVFYHRNHRSEGREKSSTVKQAAIFLLTAVVCIGALQLWFLNSPVFGLQQRTEERMPLSFWFYLGSQGDGAFEKEAYLAGTQIKSPEERSQFYTSKALDNYKAFTPASYARFWSNKMRLTWAQPLYELDIYSNWTYKENWTKQLTQPHHLAHDRLLTYCAVYTALLHLLVFAGAVIEWRKKQRHPAVFALYLLLFGVVLFFSVFETAARRAVLVLPLMMAAGALSLLDIARILDTVHRNKNMLVAAEKAGKNPL